MKPELNIEDETTIVLALTHYIDMMLTSFDKHIDKYYYKQALQANETCKKIAGNDCPHWTNFHIEKGIKL